MLCFNFYAVGQSSEILTDTVLARKYYKIGLDFQKSAQYDSAIHFFNQATIIYKTCADTDNTSYCWERYFKSYSSVGQQYKNKSNYGKADKYLQDALKTGIKVLGKQNIIIADIYSFLGYLYDSKGDFEQSLVYHQNSLQIKLRLLGENHSSLAVTYNGLGMVYTEIEDYEKALRFHEQALDIQLNNSGRNHSSVIRYNNNLGRVMYVLGDYDQALCYYQEALELGKEILGQNHSRIAITHNSIGVIYKEKGNYGKSLIHHEKAFSIWQETLGDNHNYIAHSHNNRAVTYVAQGDYRQALIYYHSALEVSRRILGESHVRLSITYDNLAIAYYMTQDYQRALHYHKKALEIALQGLGGQHSFIATIFQNLGNVSISLKQYDQALDYFQEALKIKQDILGQNHPSMAFTYGYLGAIENARGNFDRMLHFYQKGLALRKATLGNSHPLTAISYNNVGIAHLNLGNHNQSMVFFQRSLATFFPDLDTLNFYKNPQLENSDPHLQLLHPLKNKAKALLHRSLSSSLEKDLQVSLETYELAADEVDALRIGYLSPESKATLLNKAFPIYEGTMETADYLFQKTKDKKVIQQAFQAMERSKSVLLTEALRSSKAQLFAGIPESILNQEQELELSIVGYNKLILAEQEKGGKADSNKIGIWNAQHLQTKRRKDSLVSALETSYPAYHKLKFDLSVRTIEEVQSHLNPSTALFEYFVGDSVVYIFALTSEKEWFFTCEKDSIQNYTQTIQSMMKQYDMDQNDIERATEFSAFTTAAGKLYQHLLAPGLDQLQDIDELIIIPSGQLGYVPFELFLSAPPTNETENNLLYTDLPYLIKKYQIRYEYSSTLMLEDKSSPTAKHLYAGFAPQYSSDKQHITSQNRFRKLYPGTDSQFPELEHNQPEVEKSATLLGGTAFIGDMATKETFLSNAADYRILHLAMHAYVNDSLPLYSSMIFSPSGDSANDNQLFAYELYNMKLNADLAVLSACETGAGKVQRGEGIMSLARAFKYAGCPNIVMSLWKAEDESTSQIISTFYKYLDEGLEKDEALRKAKLDYLIHGENKHPFFWGTFVLVGDDAPVSTQNHGLLFGSILLIFLLAIALFYWYRRRQGNNML